MVETTCPNAVKLDPRVRRTRQLLEDALRALLHERAYGAISVGDITERATVNRATFYAHFLDKDDLVNKMMRGDLESALIASLGSSQGFSAESLHTVGIAVYKFMSGMRGNCPKTEHELPGLVETNLQDTIQQFIRHWFEMDKAAIRHFPGSTPDAVSTVLSWSLYGSAVRWSKQPKRPPAEKAVREIVSLLV